jgi:hypothetical protein
MRTFILSILACASAWGADFTCTSSGAGNLSDPAKWTSCNSTYPHNNGADKYAVIANHAIVQDVASLSLGLDNGPVNGYVTITKTTAGSGYVNCAGGAISGGTAIRAAETAVRVVNGTCELILTDRGFYSAGTPTLGAITTTNTTITGASTVKGVTTTLAIPVQQGYWHIGSTQSITISGATGAGWTAMNATWAATVVSAGSSSTGPTTFTIPFDSSALSGTPGGTITLAPGTAASYTLNYQAGGGTAAIKVGTGGKLTLSASTVTTAYGDVQLTGNFNNTTDALVWTGTGATTGSPTTLQTAGSYIYSVGIAVTTASQYRGVRTSGCVQNASDPTLPGNCKLMGNASFPARMDGGMYLFLDGLYLKWMGDESSPAIRHSSTTADGTVNSWSLTNTLFDTCGRLWHRDSAGVNSTIDHNAWINTAHSIAGPAATLNLEINSAGNVTPSGGIAYSLQRNSLDAQMGASSPSTGSGVANYTIQYNYFGGGLNTIASATATWDTNFIRRPYWTSGPNSFVSLGEWSTVAASILRTYFWIDADSAPNPHSLNVPNSHVTVDGLIYGFSGTGTGDSGEVIISSNGTSSGSMTVQNSVFLCDAAGLGSSEITTAFGSTTGAGYVYSLTHNTWCGGYGGATPFGAVQLNEGSATAAGSVTFQSNLVWSNTANTALKMNSTGTASIADACSPLGNCDYNGSWNGMATPPACTGCTNMQKSYQGKWSSTGYATHDVDGFDPQFVASTRKMENFDTGYLGKAQATAWSGGGTYAYGDLVSNTNAGTYSSESLNYRCINPAGCTGLGAPGVSGTAWRADWEFAAAYWIRALNYSGAQYTDAAIGCTGCYVVQALNNWVTAGFAPQNSSFRGTGEGGTDIGAVVAIISNGVRNALFFAIP